MFHTIIVEKCPQCNKKLEYPLGLYKITCGSCGKTFTNESYDDFKISERRYFKEQEIEEFARR